MNCSTTRRWMFQSRYCRSQRQASTNGFTVVEVLTSIAIMGLLLAILLPAVQQARESARRMHCSNNLKQIGLSIETHVSSTGRYPDCHTIVLDLLPGLGESALRNKIESGGFRNQPGPTVATYLCPSDPEATFNSMSYGGNIGTGNQKYGMNGFFSTDEPGFVVGYPPDARRTTSLTRPRDITDGLSNTASMAEFLPFPTWGRYLDSGPTQAHEDFRRFFWSISPPRSSPEEMPQLMNECLAMRDAPARNVSHSNIRGRQWFITPRNIYNATYHHILPPNSPSCGTFTYGIFSSGSVHSGGAQVLFGDGHVQFVADGIDSFVWTQLGSRSE